MTGLGSDGRGVRPRPGQCRAVPGAGPSSGSPSDREHAFDASSSGQGRPARSSPAGSPIAAGGWRSSSAISSAVSARSTPACPPRRCCDRPRCWPRWHVSRARRRRSPVALDVRGGAEPAATRSSTILTIPASCRGCAIAASSCSGARGAWTASDACASARTCSSPAMRSSWRWAVARQMPPIPGLADVGAWSNREITTTRRGAREPDRARRRSGRGRDGRRLVVVRESGDSGGGDRSADRPRGADSLGRARAGAARGRSRGCTRCQGHRPLVEMATP